MSGPIPSTSRPTSAHNRTAQLERKTDIAAQPSSPQLLQPSTSSSRSRSRSRSRSSATSTSAHAITSTRASWFSTISSTWTQATSTLALTASSTLGSSTTAPIRSGTTAATAASNAQRAALPQEWKNLSDHAGLSQENRKARAMAELATSGGGPSYQAEDDPLLEILLYRVTSRTSGSGSSGAKTPLLVLAACYLPSATSLGYDTILEALTNRLESYARNGPYSLILLASPVPNPPPTARLISLFLSLSRETRKNVLKVWVVGGGWSLRALLALFTSRLLSGKAKVTRKMVHCATLGALAKEVGSAIFLSIEFPPEVYAANARHESHGDLAASLDRTSSKQFGVPLSEATEGDKEPPSCVVDCFEVLRTQGRYAWYKSRERGPDILRRTFYCRSRIDGYLSKESERNDGHTLTLPTYPDAPHLAASLLKLYLCSLPTPIFPFSLESTIISCPLSRSEAEVYLRTNLLPSLPAPERNLLGQLVDILGAIEANKAHNKMDAYNLVVCLTPTLWTGIDATGSQTQSRGATAEEIKSILGMCSVPDGKGGAEGNTVAGVLKVMIEA
ncbi:BQ5605_C015g07911 [Microbotryum silenes-dioicae]|uniref:BQ5605_C015g07911 protein n=1 Tax=Microbotryum silenes-dioicae TaxID=796604 RepID=A0A2X0NQV2_9BASI|nr:BQ5605_C015g07911 [Microbotryum silenes-dioicae]